jgi:hypothetical protein
MFCGPNAELLYDKVGSIHSYHRIVLFNLSYVVGSFVYLMNVIDGQLTLSSYKVA